MRVWLSIFAIGCMTGGLVFGQALSQISGVVRDATGAVVPGAEVTATQTDTGTKRTAMTDAGGDYTLPNLPLGPYRLEASKAGFRAYVQTGIELQVATKPVIPITLEVGQTTEQVEVQANASQVEERSASIGTVVEQQRIVDLPLNGRQAYQLITLNGAATQYIGTNATASDMSTGVDIMVAGGYESGVQYNLDGAPHMNFFAGESGVLPFPDALQEFRLSTSVQDPSTTGRSGATVNAVTKSGTNSFHGDAFEFLRNYDADGRDFFALGPDGLKRNQFGGTFGGPIKKDKLFFFLGYQGTDTRQSPFFTTTFEPTPQMVAGDFTTITSPACNSGKQLTLGAPFVNNQINPSLLSPQALKITSYLPPALNSCGLINYGIPVSENDRLVPARIDYQLTPKHSLFARYQYAGQNNKTPYSISPTSIYYAGAQGTADNENSATLGDTYLISPTIVNSFRVFGNRIDTFAPGASYIDDTTLGIPLYSYLPGYFSIGVSGAFGLATGTTGGAPDTKKHDTNFGFNDDFTWIRGSHQFAFGASYAREIMRRTGFAYAGGNITIGATTGLGLADFMLGKIATLRQSTPNPTNYGQPFPAVYAQDTWKITPKITMTYGVNWDPFFAPSFMHGYVYHFSLAGFYAGQTSTVIPTAPPGFSYPGDPGFGSKSGVAPEWANFDPRVGLAWDPFGDGKTAVRVGGGIGHDFISGFQLSNFGSVLPFGLTEVQSAVTLANPYPGGDPFPYSFNRNSPAYPSPTQIPCLANTCPPTFLPIPSNLKTAEQYSWNFAVQRQIKPSFFVSATYIGSHIIHTFDAVELNPALYISGTCGAGQYGLTAPGPCTQSGNINQRRVLNLARPNNPPLSNITSYDSSGTQGYNGLLVSTRWTLSNQVNLNANYTWSHCIGLRDSQVGPNGGGPLNPGDNYVNQGYGQNVYPVDRDLDVGDCFLDQRQIGNVTLVYQTPQFSNRLTRILATGWTFSTTLVANTGEPLNVVTNAVPDPATGFGSSDASIRPNLLLTNTASPAKGQSCSIASFCLSWLNPAAFAAPAVGSYGNLGTDAVRAPGFWEWDQALTRAFPIHEKQRLEVRVEAFNITNSVHPGSPVISLGSSTFGIISSDYTPASGTTAPARVLQFAMKYLF